MNTPSPLIPQGSLLDQKNKSRARVKVAFFCVVGVHVAAILVALLAQGCKRETAVNEPVPTEIQQPFVAEDTNAVPAFEPTNTIAETVVSNYVPPVAEPPPVTSISAPAPTVQEHIVQKGESFSTIAPKYNVTVRALQAANPTVNPTRMQIGQKLVIPPPTTAAAPVSGGITSAPSTASESGEQVYVVKTGDNLTKIAAQFGTTINAIRRANNLTTDRIKVGDKLKIPAAAPAAPR